MGGLAPPNPPLASPLLSPVGNSTDSLSGPKNVDLHVFESTVGLFSISSLAKRVIIVIVIITGVLRMQK